MNGGEGEGKGIWLERQDLGICSHDPIAQALVPIVPTLPYSEESWVCLRPQCHLLFPSEPQIPCFSKIGPGFLEGKAPWKGQQVVFPRPPFIAFRL